MRIVVASVLLAALAGSALANGRDPYASSIHFRPGMENKIMAGMTFGLISSSDGGATWQWYCERAVGYGGTYDPDYVYTPAGALFATTFDGLKVMRDGCTFAATPPGTTFVSRVERGPDDAIYYTASDPSDSKIYKSTDGGLTFPTSAMPGMLNDWWQTIMVAPSDAQRVYLSGYRLPYACSSGSSNPGATCTVVGDCPNGTCDPLPKVFLLFKSTSGGTNGSYVPMDTTDITPISQNSAIDIVGIDPTNEDIVYARVTLENATSGDSIYKSTDAGANWTKILSKASGIGGLSFLVRNDGSCVAGTRDLGAWKSKTTTCQAGDANWDVLTGAPHIGCLYKNSANEVWACTQNRASPQLGLTSDGFGIMKSSGDLSTWTGVMRFEDLTKPVSCAGGTVQEDQCVQRYMDTGSQWCCLTTQLGITSTAIDCTGPLACFSEVAGDDFPVTPPPPDEGCCNAGSRPPVLLTFLVAGTLLLRRRRRRNTEN